VERGRVGWVLRQRVGTKRHWGTLGRGGRKGWEGRVPGTEGEGFHSSETLVRRRVGSSAVSDVTT
jgi:hypothetical protein